MRRICKQGGRRMRKLTLFLLLMMLITWFAVTPLRAEVFLRAFDKWKSDETFKLYIEGVGIGYGWANTSLEHRKQSKLYCQPANLALDASNYIDIITREIQANKNIYTPDTPVELILLIGLEKTFPCDKR